MAGSGILSAIILMYQAAVPLLARTASLDSGSFAGRWAVTRPGDLVVLRPEGLYCPPGGFYIDPWRPVDRAVITHAHADHARTGHSHYLCAAPGAGVLCARLGAITLQTLPYGKPLRIQDAEVTLFPAGHVLGSSQIRIRANGQTWVVSGDYRVQADVTCDAFESVACDTFITESTFGLPIYRWQPQHVVMEQVNRWWSDNAREGRASVIYGYSFGKAQRLLAGLDTSIGPVYVHSAVATLNTAYREEGIALPQTLTLSDLREAKQAGSACIIAPPAWQTSGTLRKLGGHADAFVSGWMQLRGARRRRGVDTGFVLSDHADWDGLLKAIGGTGAQRIIVTHGAVAPLVRYLQEHGLDAEAFSTEYGAEETA